MPMTPDEERLQGLRVYLRACIKKNIISLDDLRYPVAALARLGKTMLDDMKLVGREIGEEFGSAASMSVAQGFLSLAERMGGGRRR